MAARMASGFCIIWRVMSARMLFWSPPPAVVPKRFPKGFAGGGELGLEDGLDVDVGFVVFDVVFVSVFCGCGGMNGFCEPNRLANGFAPGFAPAPPRRLANGSCGA